jgi:hypothetical protein
MAFVKYRILVERVDEYPKMRKEWRVINETTGEYGYTPETEGVERDSTEVLKMEIREEIDLRQVVKALLWSEKLKTGEVREVKA